MNFIDYTEKMSLKQCLLSPFVCYQCNYVITCVYIILFSWPVQCILEMIAFVT